MIAHAVSAAYVNHEIDRVVIVYNAFVSALVQKVTVRDLLPIPQDLLDKAGEAEEDVTGGTPDFNGAPDYIYEPEPEEILARLLPVYVETELYRALLESAASEQGARMTAMRNAVESCRRADRQPHARHEPRAPGRDHPGDPGSRCGRRRSQRVAVNPRLTTYIAVLDH